MTSTKEKVLLVIDRDTGEIERIRESNQNFLESIRFCASRAGLTFEEALTILNDGQPIMTVAFVRRFE